MADAHLTAAPPHPRHRMLAVLAFAIATLTAPTAWAAVVTVTDCVNDPHIVVHNGTRTTYLDVAATTSSCAAR